MANPIQTANITVTTDNTKQAAPESTPAEIAKQRKALEDRILSLASTLILDKTSTPHNPEERQSFNDEVAQRIDDAIIDYTDLIAQNGDDAKSEFFLNSIFNFRMNFDTHSAEQLKQNIADIKETLNKTTPPKIMGPLQFQLHLFNHLIKLSQLKKKQLGNKDNNASSEIDKDLKSLTQALNDFKKSHFYSNGLANKQEKELFDKVENVTKKFKDKDAAEQITEAQDSLLACIKDTPLNLPQLKSDSSYNFVQREIIGCVSDIRFLTSMADTIAQKVGTINNTVSGLQDVIASIPKDGINMAHDMLALPNKIIASINSGVKAVNKLTSFLNQGLSGLTQGLEMLAEKNVPLVGTLSKAAGLLNSAISKVTQTTDKLTHNVDKLTEKTNALNDKVGMALKNGVDIINKGCKVISTDLVAQACRSTTAINESARQMLNTFEAKTLAATSVTPRPSFKEDFSNPGYFVRKNCDPQEFHTALLKACNNRDVLLRCEQRDGKIHYNYKADKATIQAVAKDVHTELNKNYDDKHTSQQKTKKENKQSNEIELQDMEPKNAQLRN